MADLQVLCEDIWKEMQALLGSGIISTPAAAGGACIEDVKTVRGQREQQAKPVCRGARSTNARAMARAMESRALLVDVSVAMGDDLEITKRALLAMAQQKMIQVPSLLRLCRHPQACPPRDARRVRPQGTEAPRRPSPALRGPYHPPRAVWRRSCRKSPRSLWLAPPRSHLTPALACARSRCRPNREWAS
jgi:hypothetical protein